jgi:hypothetical protein
MPNCDLGRKASVPGPDPMLILYAMLERHNWQKYQPEDQFPLIQLVLPTGRPKSTMNLD